MNKVKQWTSNYQLRRLQLLYKYENNPLHAWEAFHLCNKRGISIPDWVMEYLATCAENIHNLKDTRPTDIAEAIGTKTKGGQGKKKQADTSNRDMAIMQSIDILKRIDPERDDVDIFVQVAEEKGLSEVTVQNIYYRNK